MIVTWETKHIRLSERTPLLRPGQNARKLYGCYADSIYGYSVRGERPTYLGRRMLTTAEGWPFLSFGVCRKLRVGELQEGSGAPDRGPRLS